MRAAFNKDTENQYKYASPHAPFKHASLALSCHQRRGERDIDRRRETEFRGLWCRCESFRARVQRKQVRYMVHNIPIVQYLFLEMLYN